MLWVRAIWGVGGNTRKLLGGATENFCVGINLSVANMNDKSNCCVWIYMQKTFHWFLFDREAEEMMKVWNENEFQW